MTDTRLLDAIRSATRTMERAAVESRLRLAMIRLGDAIAANRLERRYNPNWASQPRVPSGHPDGGQWTDGGVSAEGELRSGAFDEPVSETLGPEEAPTVLFDAMPDDDWIPGERYAQLRSRPGRTFRPVGGSWRELTLPEATRLDLAAMQYRDSLGRVRRFEQQWRPSTQVTSQTVEGEILGLRAKTREANARYFELRPQGALPFSQTPPPISPPEPPPRVPAEPPATARTANLWLRDAAKWLGGRSSILDLFEVAEAGSWVYEQLARIDSYLDPPQTLEELQRLVDEPEFGYDIHHIVEQGPALDEGHAKELVNGRGNLARIPTYKHWAITGWYGTPSPLFDGMSPRAYLRGKTWNERNLFGLHALRRFGVLGR